MNRREAIIASLVSAVSLNKGLAADAANKNNDESAGESNVPNSQTFVLVHGAWHGGWCWKYVEQELQQKGHVTHAPTLTGLAEESHLLDESVSLETHIQDILDYINANDLNDFVLVGHSYGGMVITGVADKLRSKIKSIVYLDAIVPENNDSLITSGLPKDPDMIAGIEKSVRELSPDGIRMPPPPAVTFGIPASDTENLKWVNESLTAHPLKTWLDTISLKEDTLQGLHKVYLHCVNPMLESNIGAIAQRIKSDNSWKYIQMDTGHDAMVTEPALLSELLEQAALV